MMAGTLTRQRLVLDFLWLIDFDKGRAAFGDETGRQWLMDVDAYEDMGEPTHITVTIEPGDLLN